MYKSGLLVIICVATLQKSLIVGKNENGIIPDWSKKLFIYLNLSIFCLLMSMLIHIVFYVSTTVLCNETYINVILFCKFCYNFPIFPIINLLKLTYD